MKVSASTTQMGLSISMVRAEFGTCSGNHRDGFIVGIGPVEGPGTGISMWLWRRMISADGVASTEDVKLHT